MLVKTKVSGFSKFLLSKINLAVKRKQTKIVLKKLKSYTPLLEILVAQGHIKSYEEYPDLLIIHLKIMATTHKYSPVVELNFAGRVGRKSTVSFYHLNKLQRRQGFMSTYILGTDRGLLTSPQALSRNVGGKILAKLV